ncbi:LutB/LldF family L-lactate oxidation iron-sulfur protein [Lentzea flava]|uniref:Iron-sulfur cluster-binding protein n=1 Tax=Lentzea flava TaxID=103732 RepID=A0ABQ2UCC2_9PSEU|nr:LutB/LldF family L-lactate oxidation iron-sulfur protein [Lentzea flava]MCP2197673.1 L-lactate dehydrogenase complex protein LldF [Lentzea flava]GGU21376.1 iron-sulfur cluster-binding protein [Lentzea flava]
MARNPVTWLGSPTFPKAAKAALNDTQLRQNLRKATGTIRERRAAAVTEMTDWEQLRVAGEQIKNDVLARLDTLLVELEESVTARGGVVHWARDAEEANLIVLGLCREENANEVVKVKSMATAEIGLNEALEAGGVHAIETDLAELIVQLGNDRPSHILVPAIHRNRSEIREIFQRRMGVEVSDEPADLAEAARVYLREKFLTTKVAISGANFAVADTGSIVVLESEGNGRMCLTLPETLITVMGIEKLVPTWQDLEVFLQLLPRSSTAERMNPYTSVWTGVTPGDGPQKFHLVLIDNGRTATLRDSVGRQALRCIRCSACLNVCPVYERTGGQSYGSVYPGPIGAILTPQLVGDMHDPQAASLPYASSLCGACFEVCPVRIDIPSVLTHLRAEAVEAKGRTAESVAMAAAAWIFAEASRYEKAQKAGSLARFLAKDGRITSLPWPGSKWTSSRDVPAPPAESFRAWWRKNRG